METGFADWLREEDLEFVSDRADNGKDQYRNKRYPLVYLHDFPHGVPLHESYPTVKAKYDRRVARLKRLLSEAKNRVLAVYMDSPVSAKADVVACQEAKRRLQALYPHVKVDFLMISLESGRHFKDRTIEDLGDGFTHVSFDFKDYGHGKPGYAVDLQMCADAMKSLAAVRDYRTRAEIKAMDKLTSQKKMQTAGARISWQHFLIRSRRELARLAELMVPRAILARMRAKKTTTGSP
jgi:hypothetical protein